MNWSKSLACGVHGDQKNANLSSPLTGGYYWFPTPGERTITWDVLTCHQLGYDDETRHIERWDALVDRLAAAWGKDAAVLPRSLKDCCYGLPMWRVTRPGRRSLILHGDDSPRSDWLEWVLVASRLDARSVKDLFDEHEQTMAEDRKMVARALGISVF